MKGWAACDSRTLLQLWTLPAAAGLAVGTTPSSPLPPRPAANPAGHRTQLAQLPDDQRREAAAAMVMQLVAAMGLEEDEEEEEEAA